jgi:transcriptional regulator with XRE-family HTH domain
MAKLTSLALSGATMHSSSLFTVTNNSPTSPGEALRRLRKERGLSLRRLAMLSEGAISHVHINDLEKGFASWDELSLHRIRGLARAFGVTPARLIETVEGRRVDAFEEVRLHRIPIVVEGAGLPVWGADQERTLIVTLPDTDIRGDAQLFAVVLKDDAMAPYAYKGNRVVFDYEGRPNVGDVVALEYPEGLKVRRYRGFSEAGRYLISEDATGSVCEAPKGVRLWGTAIFMVRLGAS